MKTKFKSLSVAAALLLFTTSPYLQAAVVEFTQKLQQKELAHKADIPLPTYKQFVYSHKISFENLIKLKASGLEISPLKLQLSLNGAK